MPCDGLDGHAARDQSRPYENTEVDDESPSSRPAMALTGMPRVINHAPTRAPRSIMKILHHACEELDGQAGRDQSRPYESAEVDDENPSSHPFYPPNRSQRVMNHKPANVRKLYVYLLRLCSRGSSLTGFTNAVLKQCSKPILIWLRAGERSLS